MYIYAVIIIHNGRFRFLPSISSLNEKGYSIKEVNRRVAIVKRASGDLHRIWRNRELPIPLTFTTSTSRGTRTRWMSIGAKWLNRNIRIFGSKITI